MSWASSEWKNELPSVAIQKINDLENLVERLQKEKQQRQVHVDTLEQKLGKQKRSEEKFFDEVDGVNVTICEQEEEMFAMKQEMQQLIDDNVLAEKERHRVQQDLFAKDQMIINLQKQLETKYKMKSSESLSDGQHLAGEHECNELKKKIQELENFLAKQQILMKQLEEKSKESSRSIEPAEAEIAINELKRECEVLRTTNSRLELTLKKAESDITRADGDKAVEKLGEENLKLKGELDQAFTKLHECEQKIKLLDCQKHNAEAAKNALEQKMKEKENQIVQNFKEQIQDLQNQLEDQQIEMEKIQKSLQQADTEKREMEQELKRLRSPRASISNSNSEQCIKLMEQISSKDQVIADLELQLKEARQQSEIYQVDKLNTCISKSSSKEYQSIQMEDLNCQVEYYEGLLSEKDKIITQLTSQISNYEHEIKELQELLDEKENDKIDWKAEYDEFASEKTDTPANLEEELVQLRKDLHTKDLLVQTLMSSDSENKIKDTVKELMERCDIAEKECLNWRAKVEFLESKDQTQLRQNSVLHKETQFTCHMSGNDLIKQLESELINRQAQLQDCLLEIERLKSQQNTDIENAYINLQNQFDIVCKTLAEKEEALSATLHDLELTHNAMSKVEHELKDVKRHNDYLENNCCNLQNCVKALQSDMAKEREASIITAQAQIEDLRNEFSSNEKLIKRLQDEVQSMRGCRELADQLQLALREKEEVIVNYENELDTANRAKEERNLSIQSLQAKLKMMQVELDDRESVVLEVKANQEENEVAVQYLKTIQTNMQVELQEKETLCSNLQTEINKLQTILQEMEYGNRSLQSQIEEYKMRLQQTITDKEETDTTNHSLQMEIFAMKNELQSLQKVLDEKSDKIKLQAKDISALSVELEKKEHHIIVQNIQLDKHSRNHLEKDAHIQTVVSQLKALRTEIEDKDRSPGLFSLQPDYRGYKQPNVKVVQAELEALKIQVNEQMDQYEKSLMRLDERDGSIQFLRTLLVTAQNDLEKKEKKINQLECDLKSVELRTSQQEIQIHDLKNDLKQALKTAEERNYKINTLKFELEGCQKDQEDKKTRIQNLRSQMVSLQNKFDGTLKEKEEKRTTISALRTQIQNLQNKIQLSQKDREEKRACIQTLQAELQLLQDEVEVSHKVQEKKEHKIQTLNSQLGCMKLGIEEREKMITNLHNEIQILRTTTESKDKVIENLRNQLQNSNIDVQNLNCTIEKLEAEITVFRTTLKMKEDDLKKKIVIKEDLELKVTELLQRTSALSKAKSKESEIEEMKSGLKGLGDCIQNLKTNLEENKKKLNNIDTTWNSPETNANYCALLNDVHTTKEELELKSAALTEATQILLATQEEKESLDKEIEGLFSDLEKLEFQYGSLTISELPENLWNKLKNLKDEVCLFRCAKEKDLKKQLSPGGSKAWSDDVNELQQKLLETERKVENMTVDAEELKEAMETLEFEKLELEEAREVTAAENQKLVNELKSMKLECSNLREQLTDFNKNSFQDINSDVQDYLKEIETLKLNKEEANQKIKQLETILIEAKEENESLSVQLSIEKNNLKMAVTERDILLHKLQVTDSPRPIRAHSFSEIDENQDFTELLLKLQEEKEKKQNLETVLEKLKSENESLVSKCSSLEVVSTDIMNTLEIEYKSKEMLQSKLGQMSIETMEKYNDAIAERDFLKQELANKIHEISEKNAILTEIEQKLLEADLQQQQNSEEKRQLQLRCDELDNAVQKLDGILQKEKDDLKAKLEVKWKTIIENIQVKNTELLEEKEMGCQKLKDELQTIKSQLMELNQSTIRDLEAEVKNLKIKNETLQSKLAKAQEDSEQLIADKEKLSMDINEHKERIEEMKNEILELSNHLIAATVEKEEEKVKVSAYEEDFESLSTEKEELFEKLGRLEKESNEMKCEKEELLTQIEDLKTSQVLVVTLQDKLDELKLENDQLSNRLNEVAEANKNLELEKLSLQTSATDNKTKIDDLYSQISALTTELQITKTDKDLLNSLQAEITILSEKNKELMLQLQEMTDNNASLQTEMNLLQTKNNEMAFSAANMEETFQNTKYELESKTNQFNETTVKLAELVEEMKELKTQKDSLNLLLEEVQATAENLHKEKQELEDKLREQNERLENMNKEIDQFKAEKETEKGKLDALEKEFKDLECEKCNLASALDNKEKDILKIQEESKLSYSEMEKTYEKLKIEYEELLQNLRLSENETKKLMTERTDVIERLEKQQADMSEVQNKMIALQEELIIENTAKEEKQSRIEQLENDLKLASLQKSEVLANLEKQEKELKIKEEENNFNLKTIQGLEENNLHLVCDKETLQVKLESLITENETLTATKNDFNSKLTEQIEEINRLQEKVNSITCQLNEANKMKNEIEGLQKKLSDLSSEMSDLTTKHQQKEVQLTIVQSEKDYFEKQTSDLEKQIDELKAVQESRDKENQSLVELNQKISEELAMLKMQAAQPTSVSEEVKKKLEENSELLQDNSDNFKLEYSLGKTTDSKYIPDNKFPGSTYKSTETKLTIPDSLNSIVEQDGSATSTKVVDPQYSNSECNFEIMDNEPANVFSLISGEIIEDCSKLKLSNCEIVDINNLNSNVDFYNDNQSALVPYSLKSDNSDNVLKVNESESIDSLTSSIQNLLQYLKKISQEDLQFTHSTEENDSHSDSINQEVALEKFESFDYLKFPFNKSIVKLVVALSKLLHSGMELNKMKQQSEDSSEAKTIDSEAFQTILASKDNFICELKKSLDVYEDAINSKEEELTKKQNAIKSLQSTIFELEKYVEENKQEKNNLQDICLSLQKLFEKYFNTNNILKQTTATKINFHQASAAILQSDETKNLAKSLEEQNNLEDTIKKLEEDLIASKEEINTLKVQLKTLNIYYEKCIEDAQQKYDISQKNFTEEIERKDMEIKEKDSDLKNSEITLRDTNNLLSKYESKLENIKSQLKSANEVLKLKEKEITFLKHSSEEVNVCYQAFLEKSKNEMKILNLKLESSESTYKKQIETAEQNYQQLYNSFMKDIQQKDLTIGLMEEQIQSLEKKLQQNEVLEYDTQLEKMKNDLKLTTDQLFIKENELGILKQSSEDLKENYQMVINELNSKLMAVTDFEKQLEEANQKYEMLDKKVSEEIKQKDMQIVLLQEKIALAENNLEENCVLMNNYKLKQDDFTLQLNSMNDLLKQETEEVQKWKDYAEKSKASYESDIANLNSDLQLRKNEIEKLTMELEASESIHNDYVKTANENYDALSLKLNTEIENKDLEIKSLLEKMNLLDNDSTETGLLLSDYKMKIDEVRGELSLTVEQLKEKQTEVNALKDSMKALEENHAACLDKLTKDLQTSQKEIETLSMKLEGVTSDYEKYVTETTQKQDLLTVNFNEEIREKNETIELLNEKVKCLESTNISLDECQKQLELITSELNSSSNQLSIKESEIESLKHSAEELKQNYENTIIKLKDDLKKSEQEITVQGEQLQSSVSNYEKRLKEAEQNYQELQQKLEDEIKQKDKNLEILEEKVKLSESNIEKVNDLLHECQKNLENSNSEVAATTAALQTKEDEIKSMKQSMEEIELDYDTTVNKLKTDMKLLEDDLEAQNKKFLSSATDYQKEAEQRYQELQQKFTEEMKEKDTNLAFLEEKLKLSESNSEEVNVALNECQQNLKNSKSELIVTTNALQVKEDEVKSLKQSIEEMRQDHETSMGRLTSQLKSLEEEIGSQNIKFQSSMENYEKTIKEAEQNYQDLQQKMSEQMKQDVIQTELLNEKTEAVERANVALIECRKQFEETTLKLNSIMDVIQEKENEIENLKQVNEEMKQSYEVSIAKLKTDLQNVQDEIEAQNKKFQSSSANYEKCIEEAEENYQELQQKFAEEMNQKTIQIDLLSGKTEAAEKSHADLIECQKQLEETTLKLNLTMGNVQEKEEEIESLKQANEEMKESYEVSIAKLKTDTQNVQDEIEAQNKKFQSSQANYEKCIEEAEENYQELQQKFAEEIKQKDLKVEFLDEKVKVSENKMEKVNFELNECQKELEISKSELNARTEELQVKKDEIKSLTQSIEEMKQNFEASEAKLSNRLKSLEDEIEAQNKKFQSSTANYEKCIEEAEQNIQDLQQKMSEEIKQKNEQLELLKEKIEVAEKTDAVLIECQKQLDETTLKLNSMMDIIQEKESEIESLKQAKEEMKQNFEVSVTELQTVVHQLQENNNVQKEKFECSEADYNTRLKEAEQNYQQLQHKYAEEIELKKKQIEILEEKAKILENNSGESKSAVLYYEKQVKNLKDEVDSVTGKLQIKETQIMELEEIITNLRWQLKETIDKMEIIENYCTLQLQNALECLENKEAKLNGVISQTEKLVNKVDWSSNNKTLAIKDLEVNELKNTISNLEIAKSKLENIAVNCENALRQNIIKMIKLKEQMQEVTCANSIEQEVSEGDLIKIDFQGDDEAWLSSLSSSCEQIITTLESLMCKVEETLKNANIDTDREKEIEKLKEEIKLMTSNLESMEKKHEEFTHNIQESQNKISELKTVIIQSQETQAESQNKIKLILSNSRKQEKIKLDLEKQLIEMENKIIDGNKMPAPKSSEVRLSTKQLEVSQKKPAASTKSVKKRDSSSDRNEIGSKISKDVICQKAKKVNFTMEAVQPEVKVEKENCTQVTTDKKISKLVKDPSTETKSLPNQSQPLTASNPESTSNTVKTELIPEKISKTTSRREKKEKPSTEDVQIGDCKVQ